MANGRVEGVDTSQGSFDAPWVINATGAWGAATARLAGIEAPIASCRIQVAVYHRGSDGPRSHPIVADFRTACYLRPEVGDKTLVGLIDPAEAEARVDPDDFPRKADFSFLAEVGEKLSRTYPPMAEAESSGGYASLYAITPDWHPIVDETPAGSGHVMCSGFSGHGFKLGPATGVMVADLVTDAEDPRFSHESFRLARYEERRQVEGRYRYSIVG
jgi:sarcosine oxidase subunit beta